ncbi:MAG: hypothetical protein ACRDI3_04310 [Actinomycetota bacterium]
MSKSGFFRTVAVVSAATLVLGVTVLPADAKKKKKKPKPCPTYATPEWGGEAETTVVTDKATAEAPIEFEIETGPGLGFTSPDEPAGGDGPATSFVYHNIVVDSKSSTADLFVRAEYAPTWDYDIYLRTPDGAALAYEADFNPATVGGPTPVGGNEGAHPEPGAGQIDGLTSPDCTGYTLEVASAITLGGAVTLTFWFE